VELTVRELQTNAISVVALVTRLANRMAQRREASSPPSHPWLEIAVEAATTSMGAPKHS